MPAISLVPSTVVEAWNDPEIRWYFREAHRLGVPAATSLALEAHYPAGTLGFCRLWWSAFHDGLIDRALMEELRVRLAELAGCAYCATSRLELPEPPVVTSNERDAGRRAAVLGFGDLLALRPWDLGSAAWDGLATVLEPGEVIELAVFAAWQYSGPRMLRSWGANRFKSGAGATVATLPTSLPYAEGATDSTLTRRPRATRPTAADPTDAGSAPAGWVAFIAPRPALTYARLLLADESLPDAFEAELAERFTEPELVQLGLAVAVQIGAILVDRSRSTPIASPIAILAAGG